MSDIFLSYAHEDAARVQPIAAALSSKGWSVFYDRTIPPGEEWRTYLGKALDQARCVVVIWSEHSITSQWVLDEADRAVERDALVPARIDRVRPPLGFGPVQAADLVDATELAAAFGFEALCKELERRMSGGANAAASTVPAETAAPAAVEEIVFEPSVALNPRRRQRLEAMLKSFQSYFARLGYESPGGRLGVFVDPELKDNVFYSPEDRRIVLGEALSDDADAVLRQYAHHVLTTGVGRKWRDAELKQNSVESGLADYFPCSFGDDPLFGEQSVHAVRDVYRLKDNVAMRNLDNIRTFDEAKADPEWHNVGEIWGGAFWEMRRRVGQGVADKLLFTTWKATYPKRVRGDFGVAFARALVEAAPEARRDEIRDVFIRRRLRIKT